MVDLQAAFGITPETTHMVAATFGPPPRATFAAMRDPRDAWAPGVADFIADWGHPAEDAGADDSGGSAGFEAGAEIHTTDLDAVASMRVVVIRHPPPAV